MSRKQRSSKDFVVSTAPPNESFPRVVKVFYARSDIPKNVLMNKESSQVGQKNERIVTFRQVQNVERSFGLFFRGIGGLFVFTLSWATGECLFYYIFFDGCGMNLTDASVDEDPPAFPGHISFTVTFLLFRPQKPGRSGKTIKQPLWNTGPLQNGGGGCFPPGQRTA